MKSTKILSVVGLALMFMWASAGFSGNIDGPKAKAPGITGIIYKVIIHPEFAANPGGTYLIQVVDGSGHLVVPPQVWVPGINIYTFNEKLTTGGNNLSRRAAMMISVKGPVLPNSSPFFTVPDVKVGPFWGGIVYIFNLYPKTLERETK